MDTAMGVSVAVLVVGALFLIVSAVGAAWRFSALLSQQAEELRRRSQEANAGRERLYAVLRSVPDGLVVVEGGLVCLANGPAARLWGLSPGEIAGLPLRLLAERGPDLTPLVDASPHFSGPVEMRLGARIYEVSTTPVVDREGIVVLFRDVTKARQVEQLREDLTNMLVHDLRSPLTSIHGAAQILDQAPGLGEEDRKMVGVILRSSTTLIGLVETILDLARLEANRMPVETERVVLAPLVSAAVEQIAFEAQTKGLHLEVDVPSPVAVLGDRRLLARVIINLVANAVRFTPSGKRVQVVARNGADGQVLLSVSDEGPGIAPEDRERIFDRFTQAGQKRQRGSAGLGLTFCKMAVEAQGGRIWVESEVGRGATFHVALPAWEGDDAAGKPGV